MDTENKAKQFYISLFWGITVLITLWTSSCASSSNLKQDNDIVAVQLDSTIRRGVLPNGFTYFIKSLPQPQEKLYMRFYHKAGSNQEDADQFDVAHGVEHLAFKATNKFPKGIENSEAIKKLGISSYDMLAYSGKDTEFYFDAPPDNKEAIEIALLFFRDIANGLSLTDADINSTKGELRQEFLLSGADEIDESAAEKKLHAGFFPCSQEEPDFLKNLKEQKNEVFRRFYRDWYRPDLLGLSIVGNIENVDQLELQIKQTFSDLIPASNPRKKLDCDSLFYSREPQFVLVERKPETFDFISDTKVELQIIFRDPTTMVNINNSTGIKNLVLFHLLGEIANERFKNTFIGYNSYSVGTRNSYKMDGEPPILRIIANLEYPNQEKEAFQKIIKVIRQIQKYGISSAEWEELKRVQMKFFDNQDRENPEYWINEIKKYYTRGEVLPINKLEFLKNWLSELSLSNFNDFVSDFLSKKPEDIGLIAPRGHEALTLTEKEVRSWIAEVYNEEVGPYEPPIVPTTLMDSQEIRYLKEAEIESSKTTESGAREFKLSNGIRLILKKVNPSSKFDRNKIMVDGFTRRGANCFSENDFFSAVNASNIIENGGVNGLNKFELNRFLLKNQMLPGVVSTYIGLEESGIQGSSTVNNLEILLQLIYLYHSSPNKDKKAFEDWKLREYKNYQENYGRNWIIVPTLHEGIGDNSVLSTAFGRKNLQRSLKMLKGIEKVDLEQSYKIFREIFGNARDFTFVISGDLDEDSVLPLAKKYLGNLPSSFSSRLCPSHNFQHIIRSGPEYKIIKAPENYEMKNIEYNISYVVPSLPPVDWKEQIKVETLGWVTTQKAWRIRSEMGLAVYDVRINGNFNSAMDRYEISGTFTCMPEEYPVIRREVHKIVSEMKSGQISPDVFKEGIDVMHLFYDLDKRGGKLPALHKNLYEQYRYGQPWVEPAEIEAFIENLSIEDVVETANKCFKKENLYEFAIKDYDLGKEL